MLIDIMGAPVSRSLTFRHSPPGDGAHEGAHWVIRELFNSTVALVTRRVEYGAPLEREQEKFLRRLRALLDSLTWILYPSTLTL